MLHQPTSPAPTAGPIDERVGVEADRAMDALQYGTAIFAIIVVVILAAFH